LFLYLHELQEVLLQEVQPTELRGLKENVIMGRMIPAGTGMQRYKNTFVTREFHSSLPEPTVEE
jgi:hypothetical protein